MNLHLFIDVVAWAFAVLFSLGFATGFVNSLLTDKDDKHFKHLAKCFVLATICWAWIVAG